MYVGTFFNRQTNQLMVAERINGQRITNNLPMIFEYYVQDDNGYEMGIDGERLRKVVLNNSSEMHKHKQECELGGIKTYEMNFNNVHKVLYQHYKGSGEPVLHKAFIDIEVDYDPAVAGDINNLVNNVPCAINAVTIYMDWLEQSATLALKPSSLTTEQAQEICDSLTNTFLFEDEKALIETMIGLLEDADTISGWNSEFFDIPYILHRTEKLFGKEKLKEYCLWNQQPICKEVETFGKVSKTYKLIGKWAIDYLLLYKKHTMSEHESYKLDNIAFEELGERKVEYEGTLTSLYYDDFKLFLEYNIQDTMLLHKLDSKLNYINIHNRQAHSIPVTLDSTMGTVSWFDQSVINSAHEMGLIVPDRVEGKFDEWNGIRPPGAFVQDPVVGIHEWISDTDLNSLYPSTIRCLNMSPETIVGQIKLTKTLPYLYNKIETNNLWKKKMERVPDWGAAWGGDEMFGTLEYQAVLNQTDEILTLQMENGEVSELTAKNLYDIIFAEGSNICISAFGTLFRTDKQGLIAKILSDWYADRKRMQGEKKKYQKLYEAETDPAKKAELKKQVDYWDLEQYLRKINLNSSYGALLNSGSVFYDFRLGSSTTSSGRKIVQHMASKLNEISVGEYKHTGGIIVYGDTDSSYFSLATPEFKAIHPTFEYTKENVIEYVDAIADAVDKSYSEHVKKIFNVSDENAEIIRAGREIIASRGLFVSKKRYALMVYDNEGYRCDTDGKEGKLKIKGLQIQRSDTPMVVRNLLKTMMNDLLTYNSRDKLVEIIKEFYTTQWNTLQPWEKGTPKAVNNLTEYNEQYKMNVNARLPGHVKASINWNRMLSMNVDTASDKINDGNKILVCKLKANNAFGMASIAYPRDLDTIPQWFKELPFAEGDMTQSVINKTIESIFGVLNWNIGLQCINESTDDIDDFISY